MTDFREALAALPPDPFINHDVPAEHVDDVFAPSTDSHRRFNTAWRRAEQAARESKEDSP